jgi:hypothetical protein
MSYNLTFKCKSQVGNISASQLQSFKPNGQVGKTYKSTRLEILLNKGINIHNLVLKMSQLLRFNQ